MDVADRRLVTLLQANARLTNAELAERVGLSLSACHRRVRRLEETGVIRGYGAMVDRRRLGLTVLGYVTVKLDRHSEDLLLAFTRGVEAIEEIVACYAISGTGDYLLKVAAADMDAYAEVALKKLARLPGVKDSSTNFVLSTVKQSPAFPL